MGIPLTQDINTFKIDRNEDLLLKLQEKYEIVLLQVIGKTEGVDPNKWQINVVDYGYEKKTATILYYQDTTDTNYFTHELLHLDLINDGFHDFDSFMLPTSSLKLNPIADQIFSHVFSDIMNAFSHPKMIEDFENRGYKINEFLSDFYVEPDIAGAIERIDNNFVSNELINDSISAYIQCFFIAKGNLNEEFRELYKSLDNYLLDKDEQLYLILGECWEIWSTSEISENLNVLNKLFEDVTKWYNNRLP